MKILMNLLIAMGLIVLIAAVVIYFLPNRYSVTNTIVINRPASVVYNQVANFNKWQAWSPWKEMEPGAKIVLEGSVGGEGQKMSWEGEKVGIGTMTLAALDTDQALVCNDVLTKPIHITMKDYWYFDEDSGKTTVRWTTSFGLKYPKGRLFGLMADKTVCQTEKHGLENLKKVCEALPWDTVRTTVTLAEPPPGK